MHRQSQPVIKAIEIAIAEASYRRMALVIHLLAIALLAAEEEREGPGNRNLSKAS